MVTNHPYTVMTTIRLANAGRGRPNLRGSITYIHTGMLAELTQRIIFPATYKTLLTARQARGMLRPVTLTRVRTGPAEHPGVPAAPSVRAAGGGASLDDDLPGTGRG
jgi:hypothetical protein